MKRHPGLHPLSQHHHFALIQALEMRRAAEADEPHRFAATRKAAGNFVRFWKKTGCAHFREEEEILLPAYARHARLEGDAQVMRMLADHAEIRALAADLEMALQQGAAVEKDVAWLLHDHVRLEEDEIFPRIEQILGDRELSAHRLRFTRLHAKEICDL